MSEAPHNEEQSKEQVEEQRSLPLVQSLTYGTGTFLAVGAVDLLAHLGPTGLVVGGIAAWVASQHGPALASRVREALPSPGSPQACSKTRTAPSQGSKGTRSLLDRALGRFPAEEEDTILVAEPAEPPPEPNRQTRRLVTEIAHPICLSPDLVVEADDTVGAGINIFGLKGSGKTGAAARLAEQFAPYYVAEVLFDSKGDFRSLVTDRRSDGRPYVPNGVIGVRGHAPRGRSVLSLGLQAVYDLRSWETPEQRATLICAVVEELLETVAHLLEREEPAPCLVFLDEAEYWLPQEKPSYLYPGTYRRLLDAFHTLATMGRSLGLAPVIVAQRIAKVNKDIIAEAEMNVFMKAELDIDLDRYYDYFDKRLISRERIRSFQAGEAVICLPDGSQHLTRLLKRESKHTSHTPHVTASLARFAGRSMRGPIELDPQAGGMPPTPPMAVPPATGRVPSADQAPPRRVTMPPERQPAPLPEQLAHLWQPPQASLQDLRPVEPFHPSANRVSQHAPSMPAMRPLKARLTPELEQALAAFQQGATTARPLADALKAQGIQCGKDKAAALLRRLRELGEIP